MRFSLALAGSLALHLGLLSLPPGTLGGVHHKQFRHGGLAAPAPAPLSVRLGWKIPPPPTAPPSHLLSQKIKPSAQFIASEGQSNPGQESEKIREEGNTPNQEGASSAGVPIPYYYPPTEVTRRPHIASDIDSSDIDDEMGEGKSVLILFINETGKVDKVDVETSQLPERLGILVMQQFARARFHPAEKDEQAVKSRLRIEVIIRPKP